jgi:hypothetical protein|tara:strand:+ start:4082 stop:5518 length:1437 start_codon:yes stop_codon:yes gene_type:complete
MSLCASNKIYQSIFSLLFTIPFLLTTAQARATDHATQAAEITQWQSLLSKVQGEYGSYSHYLIEPYTQLARAQLTAYRLADARRSVDKAIHNSKINSGLYAFEQIPLQKLSIEIDSLESDWVGVEEKIINLVNLVTRQLKLEPKQIIDELQWASNFRNLAALEDTEDRSALHIINSTILLEHMVMVAQRSGLTGDSFYPHLLHSLANQYYIETKAIIAGGSIGYRLRVTDPGLDFIDSRLDAIDKRYEAGLDKLHMIQHLASDPIALAFSKLNIADWKAIFDHSKNISVEYERIYEQFTLTSANQQQIDNLFATNKVLPTADLQQGFDEQLEAQQKTSSKNLELDVLCENKHRVQVTEMSKHLPNVGNTIAKRGKENMLPGNWNEISAEVTLDPHKRKTVSGDGYRVKSFVTGKEINIIDNGQIKGQELRKTVSRIKALNFRPILRNGKVEASTIFVNYSFRRDQLHSFDNLVVLGRS